MEALDEVVVAGAGALTTTTAVTSVAVGVVVDGAAGYARGFGPATSPATAFRIASITKTFTAIAVMQQHEAGRLQLADPVNAHLRSVRVVPPAGASDVTVRHLLTHSGGVGELLRVADVRQPYAGFAVRPGQPLPTLRSVYEPTVRTGVAPDTKAAYANHGFGLLGVLVEDLSGEEYGAYIRQHVLDPLGMTHTDIRRSERVGADAALGLRPRGGRPAWDLELTVPPAGGGWSTVEDLQRYAEALLAGGANASGRVLAPETLATMLEPHFRLDPRMPGRGLGFALGALGPHRLAGHDGGLPGFSSTLQFAPDAGAAAIVLANSNSLAVSAAVHRLGVDILRVVLGAPDPIAAVVDTAGPERPYAWPALAGAYVPERGVLTSTRVWRGSGPLMVREGGGHLQLRSAYGAYRPGVRLYPDGDDPAIFRFVSRGLVGRVVFQTGTDGIARHVCIADDTGQHRLRRLKRRVSS